MRPETLQAIADSYSGNVATFDSVDAMIRNHIPPNAMRVGPGTDAVVFPICYGEGREL